MRLCIIASGSAGNAYYIGAGEQHFLVDAGISGKRIENALFEMNIRSLDGIFITHEHRDHITGAGVMARRFKADIYATPLTWRYFIRHRTLGALNESQIKYIEPGQPLPLGETRVTAFDVPHDAIQPVGYTFNAGEKKIAIATDLGHATETVVNELKDAEALVLESNHDVEMLEKGPYHRDLKIRVAGKRGHLSNAQAGMLISEVAVPGHTHVFLAHLSENNNNPMLAYDTVSRVLEGNEVSVGRLQVAERSIPGDLMIYG